MKISKRVVATALALASLPVAAQAQDIATAGVKVGSTVYGPQGDVVGKVEKIVGDNVVLNTGTKVATLPGTSFGKGEKGPVIGFTQAQLNAAIEAANQQTQARIDAALVPGAALRSSDNIALGTIKTVNDNGDVVIEGKAGPFTLKKDMFGTDANGLIVRISAQALNDAIAQAKAAGTNDAAESEELAGAAEKTATEGATAAR